MALKKTKEASVAELQKEVAALKKEVVALKRQLSAKPAGGADPRVDAIIKVLKAGHPGINGLLIKENL